MEITRKTFLKGLASTAIAAGVFGRASGGLAQVREASGTPRQSHIADVTIWPFTMQQKETVRIALGTVLAENVLVRLRTGEGVVGWGESSPFAPDTGETQATDLAMAKELAALVKGRDPFALATLVHDLDAFATGPTSIKSAFEMAMWDIAGKIAGQPVCALLGRYRESFLTDVTAYLDSPQAMAEKAKQIVVQGFKIIKVKLGEAPELDIQRLAAVREAVGPNIPLRIDANQGWTPADALRALKGLEKFGVQFCEQPVPRWDWEGLKFVRERSPIPIMADEAVQSPHDAMQAVRREACDMINIKIAKAGGILNSMRIAHIAEAANMQCMLGSMSETRVGLTAAAHVVCASPNVLYADLDTYTEYHLDPVLGGMQVKDGVVTLPDKPGLGLDLDAAWLKTLRPV